MEDTWAFGSGGFAKLYGHRILNSSLMDCAVATRWVFVFMLSQADAEGRFRCASVGALARAAAVGLADAERAIAELEAPDPDSTTKEHDGRRVFRIQGGWQIINYRRYRDFRTKEQEAAAERKRRSRAARNPLEEQGECDMSRDVTDRRKTTDVRRQTSDARTDQNRLVDVDAVADRVQRIFRLYLQTMGKRSTTRLSPERERAIRRRIDEGRTDEEFELAFKGCGNSRFHMERGFTDVELICRDAVHFDRFLALADD